jgi:hypothetical protein
MCTLKSSSSPTTAIGDASASTRIPRPVANSAIRHHGTGRPSRASVRARRPYAVPTTAIGSSCSGSSVQLVRSDGSTAAL